MSGNATSVCNTVGFPDAFPDPVTSAPNAFTILLHALPVACVTFLWILAVEIPHKRGCLTRPTPAWFSLGHTAMGLLAAGAFGWLTWRLFDVLECAEEAGQDWHAWRWLGLGVAGGVHVALLFPPALPRRLPRVGLVLSLLLAAGCVTAESLLLHYGVLSGPGTGITRLLLPLQALLCLQAVLFFPRIFLAVTPRMKRACRHKVSTADPTHASSGSRAGSTHPAPWVLTMPWPYWP